MKLVLKKNCDWQLTINDQVTDLWLMVFGLDSLFNRLKCSAVLAKSWWKQSMLMCWIWGEYWGESKNGSRLHKKRLWRLQILNVNFC